MISLDAIEKTIEECADCVVSCAVVLDETESTQNAAFQAYFSGQPVLVIASKQTRGRGQRGNRWEDGEHETLACTFAIDATGHDACRLAAAAGLAAMHAVANACGPTTNTMIKWPNDVVVRNGTIDRKIGGVLIEIRDGVAMIGIGINAKQIQWTEHLGNTAVSVSQVGGDADRTRLACSLIDQFSRWICAGDDQIRSAWAEHDAMVGRNRVFLANNNRVEGTVVSVDPLNQIVVRTQSGVVNLDVRTTRNA
ncbi:MAG: biotin--[acetyl-CoA-carboxylase] ligase [Phycisphaerales bacterium]|nr:biotin--[acetyl-CoA-carboxylase] ligase [Phycisphaerales bacterium]